MYNAFNYFTLTSYRGIYDDPDICADEETKKLLKHIFKYLIFENPDLCTMETAIAVCSFVLSL